MHAATLSASQLNNILGIADDAIICVNTQHQIILFNQGAQRLFGWTEAEILGRRLDTLIPQRFHAGHGAHVDSFHRGGASARRMGERGAIFAVRRDGSEFPAEASISRLEAGDDMVYTVILRDITQRRAYERELQQAKEAAEAAMLAKSMFLANMSHEIRTPLNAVIGMTSLLLNSCVDPEQRDYAETIRSSSELLLTIINDILDYSKIDVNKLEIERHPFDLRRCIEESLDLLSPGASEKNINLAYFMDDGVPAALVGDVTRLRQVLVNLLSNSIKFTHHGEVLVTVSARAADGGGHEISFAVKDSGIGIPADRLPELFQSFTQADASTTRKYGGTGLGLTISKRLAEVMGGRMWVDSVPGAGSTFSFSIVAEAAGPALADTFLLENSAPLSGKRILIVDDNASNRRILVKQSLLWGMLPSAAVSAIEALDFVRHGHAFDVAVLDMAMPGMDGLDLAAEIRKHRSSAELPLIMLTSMAHRPRDERVEQARFSAFLNKPIKPAAMLDVLQQALNIATPVAPHAAVAETILADTLPLAILVAEDNAVNQKVVQHLLRYLGYRADVVANGAEALDALDRQHYDVVLMDVQMPGMDGLEATRRLRARHGFGNAPRVIAMTANAMPGDREACLGAGMDAYLAKPVELADLRAVLAAGGAPQRIECGVPVIEQRRIDQIRALEDERNPTLAADIIAMFLADAPGHLEAIGLALSHADAAGLEAGAHRFLSAIENLGAQRMRVHCAELERCGRERTLAGTGALLAALVREFALARAYLDSGAALA